VGLRVHGSFSLSSYEDDRGCTMGKFAIDRTWRVKLIDHFIIA
jgi:hypothetical protein